MKGSPAALVTTCLNQSSFCVCLILSLSGRDNRELIVLWQVKETCNLPFTESDQDRNFFPKAPFGLDGSSKCSQTNSCSGCPFMSLVKEANVGAGAISGQHSLLRQRYTAFVAEATPRSIRCWGNATQHSLLRQSHTAIVAEATPTRIRCWGNATQQSLLATLHSNYCEAMPHSIRCWGN